MSPDGGARALPCTTSSLMAGSKSSRLIVAGARRWCSARIVRTSSRARAAPSRCPSSTWWRCGIASASSRERPTDRVGLATSRDRVDVAWALTWTMSLGARPARWIGLDAWPAGRRRTSGSARPSGGSPWTCRPGRSRRRSGAVAWRLRDPRARSRRTLTRTNPSRPVRRGASALGSSLRVDRAHRRETGDGQRVDGALRATGHSDVGTTAADHVVGVAHRLEPGGAGGDRGVRTGARADLERDGRRRRIGHEHGHGEREDSARALLAQVVPLRQQGPHATDAGADAGGEPLRVALGAPASAHASRAAMMAYCALGSRRRTSTLLSTSSAGVFRVAANFTGRSYISTYL